MSDKEEKSKKEFKIHETPRRMVEDVLVTKFFNRHAGHKPMSLKLHAEVIEEEDSVILRSEIPGLDEENLKVGATINSIDVSIHTGKERIPVDGEQLHSEDIALHSSYVTPVPIDPNGLIVVYKDDILEVRAPKYRPKE